MPIGRWAIAAIRRSWAGPMFGRSPIHFDMVRGNHDIRIGGIDSRESVEYRGRRIPERILGDHRAVGPAIRQRTF